MPEDNNADAPPPYHGVPRKHIIAALEETQAAYSNYERRWRELKVWLESSDEHSPVSAKMEELEADAFYGC